MSEVRVTDPKTGGQKGQKDERFDLLRYDFLQECSRVYSFGAEKYAADNWAKGYSWRLSIGALFRHIVLWVLGQTYDSESGLHHLAHAFFHLSCLWTFEKYGLGTDDRLLFDKSGAAPPVLYGPSFFDVKRP